MPDAKLMVDRGCLAHCGCDHGAQVVAGIVALGRRANWASLFFATAAAWLIWVVATPVILSLSRRFPLGRAGDWRNLPVHLAAALGISIVRIAWSAALEWVINPFALHPHPSHRAMFLTMVYMQFHTGLIIYGATVAIDNVIDSMRSLLVVKLSPRGWRVNYRKRRWMSCAVNWSHISCSIR
jgi:hypothetical protein